MRTESRPFVPGVGGKAEREAWGPPCGTAVAGNLLPVTRDLPGARLPAVSRDLFSSAPAPLLAAAVLLVLSGCASSGTSGAFSSYATSFARAEEAMLRGDLAGAEAVYASDLGKEGGAALLANWEMGSFYQVASKWDESRARLDRADALARKIELRPIVSMNEAAQTAGSLLTNDNVIEFTGDGYERVMSRTLNALNYLRDRDLDGARVEIRKADEYQQLELQRHRDEVAEEEKAADREQRKAAGEAEKGTEMATRLAVMESYAAGVKSSFLNPFTFVLSGVVYEFLGEDDAAEIDYRRGLELAPRSLALQSAAFRAALRSGDEARLASYRGTFDPSVTGGGGARRAGRGEGEVIVLFQTGHVPQKREIKFPVPIPGVGVPWVAFPCYVDLDPVRDALVVSHAAGSARSEPVADIGALAVRALKEKWLGITLRQVARVTAKQVAQRQAEIQARKAGGDGAEAVASVLGFLYSALSESADLRGWYSLPAQVQAARLVLPAGAQDVELAWVRADGTRVPGTVRVEVVDGRVSLVSARSFGERLTAWSISPQGALREMKGEAR